MKIKSLVAALVKKYKTSSPFELATCLNITVLELDLHEEINGYYKYDKRNKYIIINSNLSDALKKFVIAHELGHAILHPRTNTPFLRSKTLLSVSKIEKEANRYAVELLLPDQYIYDHTHDNMTIKEIGNIYDIPSEVLHLKKF